MKIHQLNETKTMEVMLGLDLAKKLANFKLRAFPCVYRSHSLNFHFHLFITVKKGKIYLSTNEFSRSS